MRILGIDPGYGITGVGLIEAQRNQFHFLRCGTITTPPPVGDRFAQCRRDHPEVKLYKEDHFHPSVEGPELAVEEFVRAIMEA